MLVPGNQMQQNEWIELDVRCKEVEAVLVFGDGAAGQELLISSSTGLVASCEPCLVKATVTLQDSNEELL